MYKFCEAALQLGAPQHTLVLGVVLPQVKDFALHCVELEEVPVSPLLQPAEISLDVSMTWHISFSS